MACTSNRVWLAAAAMLLAACEPGQRPQSEQRETARGPGAPQAPAPPGAPPATPAPRTWGLEAGPALIVAGSTPQEAHVVFPSVDDSSLAAGASFPLDSVRGLEVDLFTRDGSKTAARLADPEVRAQRAGCTQWPFATVVTTGVPASQWSVALQSGRAEPIALDSIEALSGPDSVRIATNIARLASLLTAGDTASAFRGLPFTVEQIRRFTPAPGVQAVIAQLARRIGIEAAPREERFFLIAEARAGEPPSRLRTVYHERLEGPEESVEATDVLAALLLGPETTLLVRLHELRRGTAYSILRRTTAGWEEVWRSAYAGC